MNPLNFHQPAPQPKRSFVELNMAVLIAVPALTIVFMLFAFLMTSTVKEDGRSFVKSYELDDESTVQLLTCVPLDQLDEDGTWDGLDPIEDQKCQINKEAREVAGWAGVGIAAFIVLFFALFALVATIVQSSVTKVTVALGATFFIGYLLVENLFKRMVSNEDDIDVALMGAIPALIFVLVVIGLVAWSNKYHKSNFKEVAP